jgi:putative ABC transport system permease protein
VSPLRQLARGWRTLTRRAQSDHDLDDEVRHFFEQSVAAHIARGLSPDAARHAAQLEIGNATVMREEVRAYGWENFIETTLADLRYAARRLRRSPGFTTIAVVTLALGIGASTAIFSAVNPILFEALPYPDPDRVVTVWDRGSDGTKVDLTFGTHRELQARTRSFEAMAAMRDWEPTLTGQADPERLRGQRVSAGYFRALGVAPAMGRDFVPDDDVLDGPSVVILADAVWKRRFGSDPNLVGRQITLNDRPFTVIGVMPASFENVLSPSSEAWMPLQYDASLPLEGREWGHHLRVVARLHPGVTLQQAAGDAAAIARAPVAEFARPRHASLALGLDIWPLQDDVTRGVKPALLAVLGAVLLLLVIACVNVTNLLLARGAQRRGELAMRAALGAGRRRLIRQLLTESVVLALVGGGLGMLVARVGVYALMLVRPPGLPRLNAIQLDAPVLMFALALTTMVGVVVGLVPAMQASRNDLNQGLQRGSRRTAGVPRFTRGVLVVTEVALAVVLLVSAGLLLRSLERLFAVAPGFDTSQLLTMQVQAAGQRYADTSTTRQFFEQTLEAVRRVPGVTAAAYTSQLPLSGESDAYGVQFESTLNPNEDLPALRYATSPGYIEAMGIPLRRGRTFDASDMREGPLAALINESYARRKFGAENPIGQRLHLGSRDVPWYTIVGVVGEVKQQSLAAEQTDAVYVPANKWYAQDRVLWLVVRTAQDPASSAGAVRRAIWSIDKAQPITEVATMDSRIKTSAGERRFALVLFEAFGIVALVLAATGIYGVLAGNVSERRREIGVRAALGATRETIIGHVLGQGLGLTALGMVIGLAAAMAASRGLVSLLYSTSHLDVVTYLGVVLVLLAAAVVACWVPAWRAAQVDPVSALRSDG